MAGHFLACAAADYSLQHYTALSLLILAAVGIKTYQLLSPPLIPGRRRVSNVVLPADVLPQPHAGSLNFFSAWRCRWAWWRYAWSRGVTATELAESIREDYEIDWLHGETPKDGDIISAWDRVFVWGEDCVDMATLEGMRDISDDLGDRALDALHQMQLRQGKDVVEAIADCAAMGPTGNDFYEDDLLTFWHSVDRKPPLGCGAVSTEWLWDRGILTADQCDAIGRQEINLGVVKQPHWHPDDEGELSWMPTYESLLPGLQALYDAEEARVLARGKAVFHLYGPNLEIGLLLVGLGGGFASGRVTDVLRSTGYLMDASKSKAGADSTASATLGEDATETDYLSRLAMYVQRATEELKNKGIIGQEHDTFLDKDQDESSQSVPSQASSDRTYKRLLETAAFLLDVTETDDSLLPPSANWQYFSHHNRAASGAELLQRGGKGWQACLRVRFLHAGVRRRLLSPSSKTYPRGSGVPINQEDLLATLCAFSTAPLMALQTQGLTPSKQEIVDYIALWRHIGFYMGIEPRLLRRCFRDVHSAQAIFACISSHHFLPLAGKLDSSIPPPPSISSEFGPRNFAEGSEDFQDSQPTLHFDQGPALPLLWAVSDRLPGNMAFSTLCAIARFLLGDPLANATAIPATTPWQYLGLRLRLFVLAYPPLFSRYYPSKAWKSALCNNWIRIVRRLVLFASKGQVAQFRSHVVATHANTRKTAWKDTKGDPVIQLDPEEGRSIVLEHRRIMYEMALVSVLCFVAVAGAVYYCTNALYHTLHREYTATCM